MDLAKKIPSYVVPLYLAKQLKRIGFNENVHFMYSFDESCEGFITLTGPDDMNSNQFEAELYLSLPTWEQVLKWFRKKGFLTSIIHSSLMFPINTKGDYKGETSYYYKITKNLDGMKAHSPQESREIERECNLFTEDCFKSYESCRKRMVRMLIKLYENKIP